MTRVKQKRTRARSTIHPITPTVRVDRAEKLRARLEMAKWVKRVREKCKGAAIHKGWTHFDGRQWEFRGPAKFSIMMQATCAFDCRAKGWRAFLAQRGFKWLDGS